MTRVKICGLTREEDVDAVVDAGADAVGFISGLPSSPRNLTISRAASLMSRVPLFVTAVLVTTGEALVENSDAVKRIAPKAIQLYGSLFSPETVRSSFHAYLLKPYPVGRQESDDGRGGRPAEGEGGCQGLRRPPHRHVPEGPRRGNRADLRLERLRSDPEDHRSDPLILSGGLRPENVELAIATVAPYCVDVSSGVESAPGVKDHAKVRAFVSKANPSEERQVAQ